MWTVKYYLRTYRLPAIVVILVAAGAVFAFDRVFSPSQAELIDEGRELFVHEWQAHDELSAGGDGLGPVFNEKSCLACHFQGGIGGGGTLEKNVTAFQILPNRNNPDTMESGVIHASATETHFQESFETVRRQHPAIPESTRLVGNCTVKVVGFDPLVTQQINTPALWGVGVIDEISGFSIKNNRRARELGRVAADLKLKFDRTSAGRLRTHGMGAVGKFGWRGQFTTLEEFVATACAVELGLTNPQRAQDIPKQHQPDDSAKLDMTSHQLNALVTYCRHLPRPEQIVPTDSAARERVIQGEHVFESVGCAECHPSSIGGVTGIYSDFLLYNLEPPDSDGYSEQLEVPMPPHLPEPEEWQTPPLWGVADSAPYFHDGGAATLEAAIARHRGAARHVMKRHKQLNDRDQACLIDFLQSLRAPQAADMLPQPVGR